LKRTEPKGALGSDIEGDLEVNPEDSDYSLWRATRSDELDVVVPMFDFTRKTRGGTCPKTLGE